MSEKDQMCSKEDCSKCSACLVDMPDSNTIALINDCLTKNIKIKEGIKLVEIDESSPFKIYEEKYCNRCADYRGCLGLIDYMSMQLQDSKKSGSEGFDSMIKSMGSMTFVTRFKLLLDCVEMRNYLDKNK